MTHLRKMMLEELERRNYAQTTKSPSPAGVVRPCRPHPAVGFELPHANYNRTNPAGATVSSTVYSPSPSHHSNTH